MSSGQQAWRDELSDAVYAERLAAAQSMSAKEILAAADKLHRAATILRHESAMSRAGWEALDTLETLVRKLP